MQKPVQVTFHNVPADDSIEGLCIAEASKLERFCGRLIGCRVVVDRPHRHQRTGQLFSIRLEVTFPGGEVVVNRVPPAHRRSEKILPAIHEAFATARRQIEDKVRRQRHQVKAHDVPPHGRVRRLFPAEGYGFIETPDGREVWFHRNSVLREGFTDLVEGTEVRFVEEHGELGPQAKSVTPIGRHGHLPPADVYPPHV